MFADGYSKSALVIVAFLGISTFSDGAPAQAAGDVL